MLLKAISGPLLSRVNFKWFRECTSLKELLVTDLLFYNPLFLSGNAKYEGNGPVLDVLIMIECHLPIFPRVIKHRNGVILNPSFSTYSVDWKGIKCFQVCLNQR